MIYILLSVTFSTLLFILFKLFKKFNINTLQALVVNYFTAFSFGILLSEQEFNYEKVIQKPWYLGSFLLGFLFIAIFYVMALTSQKNGISVASVASKMSVIIPIITGVFLFNEQLGILKFIGILIALVAVYFTSKKEKGNTFDKKNLLFPIILFFGAGTIDTSLNILQHNYLKKDEIALFSSHTFLMAFLFGIVWILISILQNNQKIQGKNIVGGIVLGIPNYFSLYYLIKMLDSELFESSIIFTINNVAIVTLSSLVGILFFKEKLSVRNGIGVILALLSLLLITN